MDNTLFEDEIFNKIDFKNKALAKGEYDQCTFAQCDFSNTDLSFFDFTDCVFDGCNLSMIKTAKTAFKDVRFVNCKMVGIHFEDCSPFLFSIYLEQCTLNYASFYKLSLKKTIFKNSVLEEVDFTEADLSGAVFENCDLKKAIFDNTKIEKADFRTSYNYTIDPSKNMIKKAKFSLSAVSGLLNSFDIIIE